MRNSTESAPLDGVPRHLGKPHHVTMDNSRRTTSYSADAGRSGSARVVASSATPLGQAGIAENVGRSIDKVDSCGWHIIAAVWSAADLTGEVIIPCTSLLRNRLQVESLESAHGS